MLCPVCGFENMPNQEACARCRAQLNVAEPSEPKALRPPRAGILRLFRPAQYVVNRIVDCLPSRMSERLGRLFVGGETLPGSATAAIVLSVLPGLGHLLDGRKRAALIAFAAWAVVVVLTVNFYAGMVGGLLVGLAVGIHTGVMFDAGRVRQHAETLRSRLHVMLLLLITVGIGYFLIDRMVRRRIGFVTSAFSLAAADVEPKDYLLISRRPAAYRRGDLVMASSIDHSMYRVGHETYIDLSIPGETVFVVIAVAGDEVQASQEGVRVNGSLVRKDDLPDGRVPLPKEPLTVTVPAGRVVALCPIRRVQAMVDTEDSDVALFVWQHLYLMRTSNIRGRAVGVYLPIGRRHSFGRKDAG